LNLKHGHASRSNGFHPLYHTWGAMKARCYRRTATNYEGYGGRGVRICERWRTDFAAFLEDVGERPTSRHSLERKDNEGDYEPGNVRWATATEQARNRRDSLRVTFRGETRLLKEWAEILGIHYRILHARLSNGWSVENALGKQRRADVLLEHRGKTRSIAEWARRTGISYGTLKSRLKMGWSAKKILETPVGLQGRRILQLG
jgi:lambda repressor-like predicted transcriptional regulator